jgi:hypothetical protein
MSRAPALASPALPRTCALALALLAPACTYVQGDQHVLVTSTPAGAFILIDGGETGLTTPSMVELDGIVGSNHQITLRKRGFVDETREVYHYTTGYTSVWDQGAVDVGIWNLPLWWTIGDWVMPFGVKYAYVPHEMHVRLYAEGKGPVRSDGNVAAAPAPPSESLPSEARPSESLPSEARPSESSATPR